MTWQSAEDQKALQHCIQEIQNTFKLPSKGPFLDMLYGTLKKLLQPASHCHYGQFAPDIQ
jgi:hypothetical protein